MSQAIILRLFSSAGNLRLARLLAVDKVKLEKIFRRADHSDFQDVRRFLPPVFADLVILDPPYNLTKNYNGHVFQAKEAGAYKTWFEEVISSLMPLLRPTATVYACSGLNNDA